jgi:hypothetical protein
MGWLNMCKYCVCKSLDLGKKNNFSFLLISYLYPAILPYRTMNRIKKLWEFNNKH